MPEPFTESSKAFADRIGRTKGLVSQWAADGLPRTAAGEILVARALRWIAERKPRSTVAPLVPKLLEGLGEDAERADTSLVGALTAEAPGLLARAVMQAGGTRAEALRAAQALEGVVGQMLRAYGHARH